MGNWCPRRGSYGSFLGGVELESGVAEPEEEGTWKLGSTTGSQHHSPLNPHTTSVAEALLSSILSLGKLRLRKLKTLVEGMPVSCPEPHSDLFMSQAEFSVWALGCAWALYACVHSSGSHSYFSGKGTDCLGGQNKVVWSVDVSPVTRGTAPAAAAAVDSTS